MGNVGADDRVGGGIEMGRKQRLRRFVSFVCLVGCFCSPTVVVNV